MKHYPKDKQSEKKLGTSLTNNKLLIKFLLEVSSKRVLSILLLSVMSSILSVGFIYVILQIAQGAWFGNNSDVGIYIGLPILAIVLVGLKHLSWIQTSELMEDALERITIHIAAQLRQAELPEIEALDTSDILLKMLNAQKISEMAIKSVDLFQALIIIVLCWLYLFFLSTVMGIIFIILIFVGILLYETLQVIISPLLKEEHHKSEELFKIFNHILYGFKELKVNQQKNNDLYKAYLIPISSNIQNLRTQLAHYLNDYFHFVNICFYFILGLSVFVFSLWYSSEKSFILLSLLFYIWLPVLSILSGLPALIQGKSALNNLYLVLKNNIILQNSVDTFSDNICNSTFHTIAIHDLQFKYPEKDGFSFGPISFSLNSGKIHFIVGGNGSGKTTLIKLLCGLYAPFSGEIIIDGIPVNMMQYRALFGAVFNDAHVFDTFYGMNSVDHEHVQNWLKKFDLNHKIRLKENRFNYRKLSVGQRKRLALLIAILEDKPIYLFDEVAADQDPHFRRYFYEKLLPELKKNGKTIVVVSHDERYFCVADQVLILKHGQFTKKKTWRN